MTDKQVSREAQLRWVSIADTRPAPAFEAQRELREARVEHLVANFDLEQMGAPTVNLRDGVYWILDGNHRVEALKRLGFGEDKVEAWVYEGLSLEQEAEVFLKLNDYLVVDALTKFRVGVRAGRHPETEIEQVVTGLGLRVTRDRNVPGRIMAVAALHRTYKIGGEDGLRRTLAILRDAFGDAGMEALAISGLGQVVARYGDHLDDEWATKRLNALNGGVKGLLGKAEALYLATGRSKASCVGAAIVEIVNRGLSTRQKLRSWWK